MPVYSSRSLLKVVPPGCIMMYAGINEPESWIFCDGRSLNKDNYSELYAALQDDYGNCIYGENYNTFFIPDLRSEFVRGWSDDDKSDVGNTKTANVGEHDHNISVSMSDAGGHTHNIHNTNIDHSHDYVDDHYPENDNSAQGDQKRRDLDDGFLGSNSIDKNNKKMFYLDKTTSSAGGSHNHNMSSAGSHSHNLEVNYSNLSGDNYPQHMILMYIIKF